MGFRAFWEGVANSVGNAIGVVVEKIGNLIPGKLGDDIEIAGISIQAACNFGKRRWNDHSDGVETATAHQELEQVKENVRAQAAVKEDELIAVCVQKVSEMLDLLNFLIPEDRIVILKETYADEIRDYLSGQIMQYVTPKLSFSNAKCKEIFDIVSDDRRNEEAQAYQVKLLSDASNNFGRSCNATQGKYICKIRDVAAEELTKQQAEYVQKYALLQRLLDESMDEQQIDTERKDTLLLQAKLMLLIDLASIQEF